jgi:hypothetical protein
VTVRLLRHLQVAQHAPDVLVGTDCDEAARDLDEIPGPDQVIAAQIVVRLRRSPGDGEAGDDSTLHPLRFVSPQHRGTDLIQPGPVLRRDTVHEPRVPGLPFANVLRVCLVEVLEKRDERVLTRLHRGRPESERHHEHSIARYEIDFARDRDVPILGTRVGVVESLAGLELLPSVGDADESDGPSEPRHRRRERQGVVLALGEQHW